MTIDNGQVLGADRVRDKNTVGRPGARVRWSPCHCGFNLPDEGGEKAGGWRVGLWLRRVYRERERERERESESESERESEREGER